MVGLIQDTNRVTSSWFKNEGDLIVLIGEFKEELGGSEYLRVIQGREGGFPPSLNLAQETAVQTSCLKAMEAGIIKAAHDCSEGGMAVALAEACIASPYEKIQGAKIELNTDFTRKDALLFGESQSRIIVSIRPDRLSGLQRITYSLQVPTTVIGQVGGERLTIALKGQKVIDIPIQDLKQVWRGAIRDQMNGKAHV